MPPLRPHLLHPADGTLRRLCDDPFTVAPAARRHHAVCARCQARVTGFKSDALLVARTFTAATPGSSTGRDAPAAAHRLLDADPDAALARLRRTIAAREGEHGTASAPDPISTRAALARTVPSAAGSTLTHPGGKTMTVQTARRANRPLSRRSIGAVATAAGLAAALALTPVGSFAAGLLTIFEPQQVVALPISTADLHGLPDLRQYGTMATGGDRATPRRAATLAAASTASGLALQAPAALPAGVPSTARYEVLPQLGGVFTFSASKAEAAAAATHKSLPAMPAGLNGSTLTASAGPAVVTTYGGSADLHAVRSSGGLGNIPALVVIQAQAPTVESTGASAQTIEDYLLAQPGISPALAASIRAIGNPASTLPIPIPMSMASSHPVRVQGVQGLAIGDNTGIASGVIWEKGGQVFAVAGPQTETDILAVANGLHQ